MDSDRRVARAAHATRHNATVGDGSERAVGDGAGSVTRYQHVR